LKRLLLVLLVAVFQTIPVSWAGEVTNRTPHETLRSKRIDLKTRMENGDPNEVLNELMQVDPDWVSIFFDVAYPDSIPTAVLSSSEISFLLTQLSQRDGPEALQAVNRILDLGPGMAPHLDAYLTNSANRVSEVLIRGILDYWRDESLDQGIFERTFNSWGYGYWWRREPLLSDGFSFHVASDRIRTGLLKRKPDARLDLFLDFQLQTLANADSPEIESDFLFVLKNANPDAAAWLVERVAWIGTRPGYCPAILLEALDHADDAVVSPALDRAFCPLAENANQLHEALARVFRERSEDLKFRAAFALMQNFDDIEAVEFLMEQAANIDSPFSERALTALGDSCNHRKPVDPRLIALVAPLSHSTSPTRRRDAVRIVGTYSGTAVIDYLVEALVDPSDVVAQEARRELLERRKWTPQLGDWRFVQVALRDASKSGEYPQSDRVSDLQKEIRELK